MFKCLKLIASAFVETPNLPLESTRSSNMPAFPVSGWTPRDVTALREAEISVRNCEIGLQQVSSLGFCERHKRPASLQSFASCLTPVINVRWSGRYVVQSPSPQLGLKFP